MFTKLLPPQLSFHLSLLFPPSPPPSLLKPPSSLSISSTSSLPSLSTPQTTPHSITHQESNFPPPNQLFDENIFTRVFDIAALRVPAEKCAVLERKLRGHLLNWPRIRNIGRVVGDEVEEGLKNVVEDLRVENGLVSLNRRIYGKGEGDGERLSGVLYRDKLVKEFDSKGYLNFMNLAKLSRPKKRGKGKGNWKGKGEGGNESVARRRGVGKNEVALLEVVEEEGGEEDLSGLLGKEFKGGKWKGSTRLLLLDERYADKAFDELPEAIKVINACLLVL